MSQYSIAPPTPAPAPPGNFPITPYVVGPAGTAGYQDLQTLINSIKTQFGSHVIFIQPGLYVTNLDFTGFTFDCNIVIRATPLHAESAIDGVTIVGTITPPNSGFVYLENLNLDSTSGDIFFSNAAGNANIWMRNCNAETVAGGYIFNMPNWVAPGNLILENYRASGPATANSIINNTAGASLTIFDSPFVGTLTGSSSTVSGTTTIQNSNVYCPLNFVTGASLTANTSTFNSTVTFSSNSTATLSFCNFLPAANQAITMSSSGNVTISSSIVNSSNNPSIDGAGVGILTLNDIVWVNNANISSLLTLAGNSLTPNTNTALNTGNLTIKSTSVNSTTNTGFLQAIVNGQTVYIPYFANINP